MPLSIPVPVVFTLSKRAEALCKLSSEHQTEAQVNPLAAVHEVVIRVLVACVKVVGHYIAPRVQPKVFFVVVEVKSNNR